MIFDAFGFETSSHSAEAVAALGDAVTGLAGHKPATGPAISRALAADPDLVAAHALKGFANLILARQELQATAAAAHADAVSAINRTAMATADEANLVAALGLALAGKTRVAVERIDAGFRDRPGLFLPFKISNALRFMQGDSKGMLEQSDNMLASWRPEMPLSGYLLGCHAFALEENGFYSAAENFGRRAVSIEPDDAWGAHAVAHVFEMRGDVRAGISWLEEGRSRWSRCNNFSFHMAWHLALFHLETGQFDQALDVYDGAVRPEPTDDFRDIANAVSLLWRLRLHGVEVGHRWDELAVIAARRRNDTTLIFAMLHNLVALVATGNRIAAEELMRHLSEKALGSDDQALVAREIGLPLARVLIGGPRTRPIDEILLALPRMGGSHAQRDLFVLSLADHARSHGDLTTLGFIRRARRRIKAEDRLIACFDEVEASRSRIA